ncbi:selenium cofactor biosynthesis protein YqeC [Paradesulfitobacterium ferrireducens]|uniref:selenium cofactor biosynthesis protein YqeC n=1 Tax=Paradesulfitobacterium ferrireducens TaxID=2816476 RepID=UPI001A8DEE2D|nr:selenium cofactor biosynthesis protein YqeC [Paradesulfitobacterium ferrireducens]
MIRRGSLWEMTGHARVITLIGAGGKTTSLQRLGHEIQTSGQEAVLTTTTKVWPFLEADVWRSPDLPPPRVNSTGLWFWYAQEETESGKWLGPEIGIIDQALSDFLLYEGGSRDKNSSRVWVIEGDGAKEKSLKFWAGHEPQIPSRTECAILVMDGSLWGKRLSAAEMHRPEYGRAFQGRVFAAEFIREYLLTSPAFSPGYAHMSWVIVLNEKGLGELVGLGDLIENENITGLYQAHQRPGHLRLAAGDCRSGEMRWAELW